MSGQNEAHEAYRAVLHAKSAFSQQKWRDCALSILSAMSSAPGLSHDEELMRMLSMAVIQYVQLLELQGKQQQARWLFRQALSVVPEDPELLQGFIGSSIPSGHVHEALDAALHALHACHGSPLHAAIADSVKALVLDRWHFEMLNDRRRNEAYLGAIEQEVAAFIATHKRRPFVLDLGAGTGILSMFAARAGAEHVWACEMNVALSDIAKKCIIKNEFADSITVLNDHSDNLPARKDQYRLPPEGFDMVISELVDAALFGEHLMPSIKNIRSLCRQGVRIIPYSATVFACCIECPQVARTLLSPRYSFSLPYSCESLDKCDCKYLSDAIVVAQTNFLDELPISSHTPLPVRQGSIDALALWWNMQLTADGKFNLTSSPTPSSTKWQQAVFPLGHQFKETSQCVVNFQYDGRLIELTLERPMDSLVFEEKLSLTDVELSAANDVHYNAFLADCLETALRSESTVIVLIAGKYPFWLLDVTQLEIPKPIFVFLETDIMGSLSPHANVSIFHNELELCTRLAGFDADETKVSIVVDLLDRNGMWQQHQLLKVYRLYIWLEEYCQSPSVEPAYLQVHGFPCSFEGLQDCTLVHQKNTCDLNLDAVNCLATNGFRDIELHRYPLHPTGNLVVLHESSLHDLIQKLKSESVDFKKAVYSNSDALGFRYAFRLSTSGQNVFDSLNSFFGSAVCLVPQSTQTLIVCGTLDPTEGCVLACKLNDE